MSAPTEGSVPSLPITPPAGAVLTDSYCDAYPRLHAHSAKQPPPPRGKVTFPVSVPYLADSSLAPPTPNVYQRLDALFNGPTAAAGTPLGVGTDGFTLGPRSSPASAAPLPAPTDCSTTDSSSQGGKSAAVKHPEGAFVSPFARALRYGVARAAAAVSRILLRSDGTLVAGGDYVRASAELRGPLPLPPEASLRGAGATEEGPVLDWDTGALLYPQRAPFYEHHSSSGSSSSHSSSSNGVSSSAASAPSDWLGGAPPLPPRALTQPLITLSNHASTIDEPLLSSALAPATMGDEATMRWTPCAQDICFASFPAAAFFYLGRALPLQRGAGLLQPELARVGALVARGEWVHIFPEGKVVYEPIYKTFDGDSGSSSDSRRGDDRGHHDRGHHDRGHDSGAGRGPALLAPARWGVGKLAVDGALPWALRQVDAELAAAAAATAGGASPRTDSAELPPLPPLLVPFIHDSVASVMPGSSTFPLPRRLRSLLSLPSSSPSPAPPPATLRDGPPLPYLDVVRGYAHHLRAWQQGRVPFSPRIESAYAEVARRGHVAVAELLGRGPAAPAAHGHFAAGGLLRGRDANPAAAETAAGAPGAWARAVGVGTDAGVGTGARLGWAVDPYGGVVDLDPYGGVPLGYPHLAEYERARQRNALLLLLERRRSESANGDRAGSDNWNGSGNAAVVHTAASGGGSGGFVCAPLAKGGAPWREPGWYMPPVPAAPTGTLSNYNSSCGSSSGIKEGQGGVGLLRAAEARLTGHMARQHGHQQQGHGHEKK